MRTDPSAPTDANMLVPRAKAMSYTCKRRAGGRGDTRHHKKSDCKPQSAHHHAPGVAPTSAHAVAHGHVGIKKNPRQKGGFLPPNPTFILPRVAVPLDRVR